MTGGYFSNPLHSLCTKDALSSGRIRSLVVADAMESLSSTRASQAAAVVARCRHDNAKVPFAAGHLPGASHRDTVESFVCDPAFALNTSSFIGWTTEQVAKDRSAIPGER